jgi:hypothetical protein
MKISIDKIIKANQPKIGFLRNPSNLSKPEAAHNSKFDGYYL